jgi:hypothetical protein
MRFYIEAGLATVSAALGALTIAWHDWIEMLTGLDPDAHDGTLEWLIVIGLLTVSAASALLAKRDYLRARVRAA